MASRYLRKNRSSSTPFLQRTGFVARTRLLTTLRTDVRAVIEERYACKAFLPTPVPKATLKEILRLTQRAPTSFNVQPYACILVREQKDRDKLADAMMATNARRVQEAPVVAVFAADLEPTKRVPRLQQLAHDNGASGDFVNNMPHVVRLFSGEGTVASVLRAIISTAVSPLRPAPSNVSTEAWAFKQTAFVAATFLYAAQMHGLATCPMEGFDQTRVKNALDIPDRYSVPVVIALGHADPAVKHDKLSGRLDPTEVFFDGKFGRSSKTIFTDK